MDDYQDEKIKRMHADQEEIDWNQREDEGRRAIYGKTVGDTAVVRRGNEGGIETDWEISGFTQDPEGNNRVVVTKEESGRTLQKLIREDDFWSHNFEKSEEIVGELIKNINEKGSYAIQGVEGDLELKVREQEEARKILDDFMKGEFRGALDYFQRDLQSRKDSKKQFEKSIGESEEKLGRIKANLERVDIEDINIIKDLKEDLEREEKFLARDKERLREISSEVQNLTSIVNKLKEKIREKPLS